MCDSWLFRLDIETIKGLVLKELGADCAIEIGGNFEKLRFNFGRKFESFLGRQVLVKSILQLKKILTKNSLSKCNTPIHHGNSKPISSASL